MSMARSVRLACVLVPLLVACGDSGAPDPRTAGPGGRDAAGASTPLPAAPRLATHNPVFPPPEQMVAPSDLPGSLDPRADLKPKTGPRAIVVTPLQRGARTEGLEILFSQPMEVAEGALDAAPYLTLTPPVAGKVEWRDDRRLVWRPNAPLTPATRYAVEVKGGIDLWGQPLAEVRKTEFDTRGLTVTTEGYATFDSPTRFDDARGLVITFAAPVALGRLKAALALEEADAKDGLVSSPKAVPVEVTLAAAGAGTGDAASGTQFAIRPQAGAAIDRWYRVRVKAGLESVDSLRLAVDTSFIARGKQSLRVRTFSCGYPCTALDAWRVSFTDVVDPEALAGCITVSPELPIEVQADATMLTVRPQAARIGVSYTLTATTACKTADGRALGVAESSTFKIARPAPVLGMVEGVGFMAPVSGGTPKVTLRAGWTGPVTMQLASLDHDALVAALPLITQDGGGLNLWALGTKPAEAFAVIPPPEAEDRVVSIPVPIARHLQPSGRGLVFVEASSRPLQAYDQNLRRSALVAVTDLSLVAKRTPGETLMWVSSFTDDRPLAQVKVELYTRAGVLVWSGETDADGLAHGPGVPSREESNPAAILVASRGDDLAFLDLIGGGAHFEAQRFGVPAEWEASDEGVTGLVFTERGVYRAGETVHVKGYVRHEEEGVLAAIDGMMTVTVSDPSGDTLVKTDLELGPASDFALDVALASGAKLGRYAIDVRANDEPSGDASVSHLVGSFRVEAYRPNNFEVKVEAPALADGHLKGTVTGRYYYGAPMAGAAAQWWVHRHADTFTPAGFERFQFGTPTAYDEAWQPAGTATDTVTQGVAALDDKGQLAVDAVIDPKKIGDRPYRFELESEVTDVDQQVVASRASVRSLPADALPGVRVASAFAVAGEPIQVEVVVVSPSGAALADQKVALRWLRRTWKSKRVPAPGGGWTWQSERNDEIAQEEMLTSDAQGAAKVELAAKVAGEHWLEAETTDAQGKHAAARVQIWVSGEGATWRAENDGTVRITSEKARYKVGDTARFIVQSPYARGMALATVERSGVLWTKRFAFTSAAPVIEFPVTDAMRPNAFVSIVVEGDEPTDGKGKGARRPSARVGVARLDIDNSDRRLSVAVTPDQPRYLPRTHVRAQVVVKDANGAPVAGHVTFMAVDEGVLSLTGYVTPDVHAAVMHPRGLASVTSVAREREWQRLTVDLDREKSDWGGDGETGAATNFRSAFATTAAFMPNVAVDANGIANVEFDLPDNLTRFRLMAVAATDDGRFGSADERIEVSKPLTVRPGLPRFLSVGDTFEARAVVQAAAGPAAGPVEVTAQVTGPVEIDGASVKTITLEGARAQAVTFTARAKAPGAASFAFKVRDTGAPAGTAEDGVAVELAVQWPSPTRRALAIEHLTGEKREADLALKLPETVRDDVGALTVTVSATELGELLPGLRYLVEYPYGCVEQTTGATLPLLVMRMLDKDFELPGVSAADVAKRAQAGLDRLRGMQTGSGGLGYWPGDDRPHPWGSVYGGYALVLASKMDGLVVPERTLTRLLDYLRMILSEEADTERYDWREELSAVKPFAAYVLALAGKPEAGFMGILYEERASLPDFGKALLALALKEAKGDAKQIEALMADVMTLAKREGDGLVMRRAEPHYWDSTMDSDARSTALALMALLAATPDDARTSELGRGLLSMRSEGGTWDGDTQATAFATIALGQAFARATKAGGAGEVVVKLGDDVLGKVTVSGTDAKPQTITMPMAALRAHDGKHLTITRGGELKALHATLTLDWAARELPKAPVRHGLSVKRRFEKVGGDGHELTDAELGALSAGDMLEVTLTVSTPEMRRYVAIDDLLPAGLEPVTSDFATASSASADADSGGDASLFSYAERKDDRVLLFANELPAGSSSSRYLVRATSSGQFTLPSARAHAMYHPEIFGFTASSTVTIK